MRAISGARGRQAELNLSGCLGGWRQLLSEQRHACGAWASLREAKERRRHSPLVMPYGRSTARCGRKIPPPGANPYHNSPAISMTERE